MAPLEIAGFKFEKGKITISTDNVQDIIDVARIIQEVLPEKTHTLAVDVDAPALRWNLIMWAHNYFKEGSSQIKSEKDHILALSQKLERGGTLSEEDQVFLKGLEDILTGLYSRRADFNRDFDLIRFLVLKSSPDSDIRKMWDGFIHDSKGRTFTLLGFEAILLHLKHGHSLESGYIELFNTIISSSLHYVIKKATSLALEDITSGHVKVKVDEAAFSFTLANDDHFQILVEILTNLISNAARYRNPQKRGEVHITIRRTDDGTEIEVRDNGIGISEDQLNNIGQFGFRVGEKPLDGSHGHGLWQVQKNLDDLRWGKLRVSSVHGEGSTFRFTIPKHDIHIE